MSAKTVIAAWLLHNQNEDCFTAGEKIVAELHKRGYAIVPMMREAAIGGVAVA